MRLKLTLLFLYLSSVLIAQDLKTINANQAKDSDFFDYEDYDENMNPIGETEFLKGCSWYCGGSVKSIIASSELNENNGINYSPSNAHDFDKNTAWVEGSADYGIGEFIEYHFNFDEINFPANKTTRLKFEILDIYKGDKYDDTALSLLMFEGTGVH